MKKDKNTTEDKLKEEIERQLELSKTLPSGSEEQVNVLRNVSELCKTSVEMSTAKSNKFNSWIQRALEAVGIVLPVVFYSSWMKRGFKFEETGVFTSTTFRGLFGKFHPFRK